MRANTSVCSILLVASLGIAQIVTADEPADPLAEAAACQARGEANFRAGKIAASIAEFDRFLEIYPEREPHHWQRGISYYYAGQYKKGVRQFESHQRVNPQDVENSIWHYLCKARVDGMEEARKSLIEIRSDRRPWAMTVYRMYRGEVTPDEALEQVTRASRSASDRQYNLFYTHLYIGLLHESAGRPAASLKHIKLAADACPFDLYMGDVARVHLKLRSATGQ